MTNNPLIDLENLGQGVWLDYIRRDLFTSGELKRLIEDDGLTGMTSNPTIFEKAISSSTDYDSQLRNLLKADPNTTADTLYEKIAIQDIQNAADFFMPVYKSKNGMDGFVSLEVSPDLAGDTLGTITQARRLWKTVARPNVMIKVPGTKQGIPAIETLISEGINVNITLMFTMAHYEAVAQAYIRGLQRAQKPEGIASVASFFVSRVDTVVDKALEAVGTKEALNLRGQVAIANSRVVYGRFLEIFEGLSFATLRQKGARVQRPLWASTGTKNPNYSDVLYVEELAGQNTVNTMPPETLFDFRQHGVARKDEVQKGHPQEILGALAQVGIDLNAIGEKLQQDGVDSFALSFKKLLSALEEKRKNLVILAGDIGGTKTNLGYFVLEKGKFTPKKIHNFHNADYPEFTSILKEFLREHPGKIHGACFGVAGPVINGVCLTTNLPWVVDTSSLKALLGIKEVTLINDMEATAYGIGALPKTALAVLNKGKAVAQGNIAVIAAGTGLGEGMLIWDGLHYRAVASEGGHSDFAPCNSLELDLCKYLLKKFGHSSYERVLSGPGLLNIYDFLKTRNFAKEPAWLKKEMTQEAPGSVITKNALHGRNKLCVKTLDIFCNIYGAEAGNLALKVLGLGGVYLGGGIVPKILPKLQDGVFRKAFLEKGRFSKFLSRIPVYAILEEKAALHGAAVYALQTTATRDS